MDNEENTERGDSSLDSSLEDAVLLSKIKALKDQIAFKRNKNNGINQPNEGTETARVNGKTGANETDSVTKEIQNDSDSSASQFFDDSDADPDFIPTTPKKKKQYYVPILHQRVKSPSAKKSITVSATLQEVPSTSAPSPHSSELPITHGQTDTSDDRVKKRKCRNAEERHADNIAKRAKKNTKHGGKKGCDDKCNKKCTALFDEEKRKEINGLSWIEDWVEQKKFIQRQKQGVPDFISARCVGSSFPRMGKKELR